MPQKQNLSNWNEILLKNLQKSILLSTTDKEYWKTISPELPPIIIQLIGEQLRDSNIKIDQFIELALAEDNNHQLLSELKTIIQKTTRNIHSTKEHLEKKEAERKIEKQIKNL